MEARLTLTADDGTPLAYWRRRSGRGAAPALLLLHGAASNHTRWSELVETASFADAFDVLRPDLRGNGASMVRGRLDLETWSCDLRALLDELGHAQAVIVGHSLGAQIAIDFAYRHPARARALVLIDPVFRRALTGKRKLLSRLGPLWSVAIWTVRGLNRLGLHRRRIDAERDLRELDEETRRALRGSESHLEIARRYSALGPILAHMPVGNYMQQLRAMLVELPPLEALDAPVLVLLSTGITFADPAINREEIARFPDAKTVMIEANHWPLTERPDEVRVAIESWIADRLSSAPIL